MIYLIFGLIAIELFFQFRALAAVVGSRERYISLSIRRMASWAVNILFIAEGLVFLAAGDTSQALWYLVFGILGLFFEIRAHRNDDDWFNGRGTKIRKGLRRMLTRPRRQFQPAFG